MWACNLDQQGMWSQVIFNWILEWHVRFTTVLLKALPDLERRDNHAFHFEKCLFSSVVSLSVVSLSVVSLSVVSLSVISLC